ncbi:MAG: hypothetical protein H5T83_00030, partial [Actinotalea sp.]|nr:hypothetical protein [Actinotalea sp.]
ATPVPEAGPEDDVDATLRPGVVPPQGRRTEDVPPAPTATEPPLTRGAAPGTPVPPSPATPEPAATPEPSAGRGDVPDTPAPDTPAPGTPAPDTSAPDTAPDPAGLPLDDPTGLPLGTADTDTASSATPRHARPEPEEQPLPPARLGVLVSPRVAEVLGDELLHLDTVLRDTVGGEAWDVVVVPDALADRVPSPPALLEAARDRLLDEGWHVAVVLTAVPLVQARHAVATQTAPLHGVGLISMPALGTTDVGPRTHRAVARVVGDLLDVRVVADTAARDDDAAAQVRTRLRRLTADDDPAGPGGPRLAARVLRTDAGLLGAQLRANRPWRLLAPLSRALTAAGAAVLLALLTTGVWRLGDAAGPGRLVLVSLLSAAAVTTALIAGARLWERPRRERERRRVMRFDLATLGSVVVGVLVLHVTLLLVALVGAALLVDAGVLAEVLGREPDAGTWWRLAWLTAGLATFAAAVGAGLEHDDVVRSAAFTRSRESADEAAAPAEPAAGRGEDRQDRPDADEPDAGDQPG